MPAWPQDRTRLALAAGGVDRLHEDVPVRGAHLGSTRRAQCLFFAIAINSNKDITKGASLTCVRSYVQHNRSAILRFMSNKSCCARNSGSHVQRFLYVSPKEQGNPSVTTILIRPKFCVMNYICPANRVCGNPERPCHPGLGCAGAANRPGLDNTDIYLGLEPTKQHVETRQNKITMHQKYKQKGKTTRLALLCVHSW